MRKASRKPAKMSAKKQEKKAAVPAMLAIFMLAICGIVYMAMYCQRLIGAFFTDGGDIDDMFNFGA